MTKRGNVRHLFPGANTPQGFYSLYDNIAAVDANKIFVIKGGPGVGKSTFMKKIAEELLSQGLDVEFHHCSADNNSLDAIYIPAADTALLDGTAPHVVDPKHPGAVDEIIHLGDYWNEEAMREPANKAAILRTNAACSFRFKRANDALRAAKAYFEEWKSYYAACLDTAALNARTEELAGEIFPALTGRKGSVRRLFASAVTYDGPKHWLDSLFGEAGRRYVITGEPGTGKSKLVTRIAETAIARGHHVEAYHCPLYPDQVDHLYIRDLGVAVITSAWPHEWAVREGDIVVDTNQFVDQAKLAAFESDIEAASAGYRAAVEREIHHLGEAKRIHDEMERYYIPHMDFAAIEERRVRTLRRILELVAERQAVSSAPVQSR